MPHSHQIWVVFFFKSDLQALIGQIAEAAFGQVAVDRTSRLSTLRTAPVLGTVESVKEAQLRIGLVLLVSSPFRADWDLFNVQIRKKPFVHWLLVVFVQCLHVQIELLLLLLLLRSIESNLYGIGG